MLPQQAKTIPRAISILSNSTRTIYGGGRDPIRPPTSANQAPYNQGYCQAKKEREREKYYDQNLDREREQSSGPSLFNPFEVVRKGVETVNEAVFGSRKPQSPTQKSSLTPSYRPFIDVEHPVDTEIYRLQNPIVEENGAKKFKLEFDLRRFNQNDVKINTNAKDCCLSIEAKKSDKNSKFEFYRQVTIPDGVKPQEITCDFKSDGVLVVEAPYYEPAKMKPRQDTKMEINHE